MEMAKLSEAQVKALRAIRDDKVEPINKRTLDALRGIMFAIKQENGGPSARLACEFALTPTGRTLLDEYERAERVKQEQAERASRPVPASAFVEPSARTAPVMGLEYDEDEQDEEPMCREGDDEPHPIGSPECILTQLAEGEREPSGPTVQLTPRPEDVEQEATDAEILQLLTMLDHGVIVARGLYQDFWSDNLVFTARPDRFNRAARDAVRFGLARQNYAQRMYALEAEPIHLLTGDGQVTPCGRYPEAARKSGKRLRVTADPSKVTHDFCQE